MSDNCCRVGSITIGPERPLTIIGGPCVVEDDKTNIRIGQTLRDACERSGLPYIFKASFDKANRTSVDSPRGPGLDAGLEALARVGRELGVPLTTDVHDPSQAGPAAEVVDLLQVPAFLSRQTDLLAACGATGRAVNVKKGQFMAPGEMLHVIGKLLATECTDVMVTERGTFFGYHRLVNDFVGVGDLIDLGVAVCFDVTHSTQLPGAANETAGRPERAGLLARAASAAGVHAIFLECHPDPARAQSDGSTVQPLAAAEQIIGEIAAIREALDGRRAVRTS